ncbi:MAG: GAF domain-containing protein [Chloroflexota bacterium]|nr:GAF domain-containing protein [Chloroflexota bacterium]
MGNALPNVCLPALKRRDAELKVLHLIAQAVNFTIPVDDVLELIYTQLSRVIELPNFYIAFTDVGREHFSLVFYVQEYERIYRVREWNIATGLTGSLYRKGITIRTLDYVAACEVRGVLPQEAEDIRAWMGVPLLAEDQTIGVMAAFYNDEAAAFSEEDEDFFTTVASHLAAGIERRRLHDRLETRAHQLKALNEIGKLLASSLNLDEVLDLVVRNAAELLDAEAGSLLLVDEENGDLVFRISSGPVGDKLVGMRIPAGKGIAGEAFADNRPVIVNDMEHDDRWYQLFDEQAHFVTRSLLAVPLNARGRNIGVLEVINHLAQRPFEDEDVSLLQSFGAQAAIAIENAQLFTTTDQALQDRVEELTTFQQIDRQLNATLDYERVMELTLSWAIRITGAELGVMAALQEGEDGLRSLRLLATEGYPEEIVGQYTGDELWPLERGLIGRTVILSQPLLVHDVTSDPHYVEIVTGMHSQFSIPMRRENRVIGVLGLESADADCFSEEKMDFVTRLVDHAAIAIDNARLFRQVQRANDAKTEFIDFVSHELKQPMTSMRGYIDLLKAGVAGPLNAKQTQFLDVARSGVQRMDRLVSDLLAISRIESGRVQLILKLISPDEVTTEAVEAFHQVFEAKNQTLVVGDSDELPPIQGDQGRLVQVLTNLLSNASKYTPAGGRVVVRLERVELEGQTYIRWQVADDGIGMTPEEMGNLFTKFYRADNPEVRKERGTGLGLAISRSIVEMHGGHVQVESEPEHGSIFSIMIPAAEIEE